MKQKLAVQALTSIFLATSLFYTEDSLRAQEGPIIVDSNNSSYTQALSDDDLAKLVFEDQLIQAWIDDPVFYKAMRDVADNPMNVKKWENIFIGRDYRQSQINEFSETKTGFGLPLGEVIGLTIETSTTIDSREKRLLSYQRDLNAEREIFYQEMKENMPAVRDLAKRYADIAYLPDGNEEKATFSYMDEFYKEQVQSRSDKFLSPDSYDVLINRANGPADILTRLGLTADEVRDIRQNRRTIEDVLSSKGKNEEDIKREIYNFYSNQNITIIDQSVSSKFSNPDRESERLSLLSLGQEIEDEINNNSSSYTEQEIDNLRRHKGSLDLRIKSLDLEDHRETMQGFRNYNQLFRSSVSLLFPDSKEFNDIGVAVGAGIDFYDSIGNMVINGSLDPTNVTGALNAVNVAVSLFNGKNKKSAEVLLLEQVLENQRKIMATLSNVDRKIDILNQKINEIQDVLSNVEGYLEQVDDEIISLGIKIDSLDVRAAERQQTFAKENFVENDRANTEKVLVDFRNATGSLYASAIKCLAEDICNQNSVDLFKEIKQQASVLHYRIMNTLSDTETFTGSQDLLSRSPEVLLENFNSDPSLGISDLNEMVDWINSKTENIEGLKNKKIDPSLFDSVPHPYYLTEVYVPDYARLISFLPPYDDATNTQDLKDIYGSLTKVEYSAQAARQIVPIALAITDNLHRQLAQYAHDFIDIQKSSAFRNYSYLSGSNWGSVDKFKSIFYEGSDQQIVNHIMSLNTEQIIEMSNIIDLVSGRSVITNENGNLVGYIQVSDEASYMFGISKFKGPYGIKISENDKPLDISEEDKKLIAEATLKIAHHARYSIKNEWQERGIGSPDDIFSGRDKFEELFFSGDSQALLNYINGLNNSELISLGEDLSLFEMRSLELTRGGPLSHYILLSDEAISRLKIGQFDKEDNVGLKLYSNGEPFPEAGLIELMDNILYVNEEPRRPLNFGTEVDLSDKNRKAIENAFLLYVDHRRNSIESLWKARLEPTKAEMQIDLATSAFIASTMIKIGYGGCLNEDEDFKVLLEKQKKLAALTLSMLSLSGAEGIQDIYKETINIQTLGTDLSKGANPIDVAENNQCALGWGNVKGARDVLDELKLLGPN